MKREHWMVRRVHLGLWGGERRGRDEDGMCGIGT